MICPDVNLLLYAHNADFPEHERAKKWLEESFSSAAPVGLCHVVVLGFIRLATNGKIFPNPLSLDQAVGLVDSWLAQPNVRLVPPSESHWQVLKKMLSAGRAGGNLTTDAHIAALASEYGMVVHSNDADFARFPGVSVRNPLLDIPAA